MAGLDSIGTFMISCPQRDAVRRETLARYADSDLQTLPLRVVLDTEAIEARGFQIERKQTRQEMVARFALEQALASGVSYILFLEDDLDFNLHVRHNLSHWEPLLRDDITLAGLYHPVLRELEHGTRYFTADPASIYGSQAFLLKATCARYILEHWDEAQGMQDIKFSRLAARLGNPLYYHRPSLVQHIAAESTWGGSHHSAVDFDKAFRASPAPVC